MKKFFAIIISFSSALSVFAADSNGAIITNPLRSSSFEQFAKTISNLALTIGIPIAALFIIYSGLKLVMARGNEESIKKATTGLTWAIIGSGILIGAWTIMKILQSTVESL